MPPNDSLPSADLREDLRRRWQDFWRSFNLAPGAAPDCETLFAAYESAGRHYHNLAHIRDCLRQLKAVQHLADDPRLIELAIWFHDVVYDPKSHNNEERSADFARAMLSDAGVSDSVLEPISKFILATKHAACPAEPDAKLLVDIDLSILAKPVDEFDAYEYAVRREYQFVPDDVFRAGRAGILKRFLERPHIYCTDFFRQQCEAAARENLLRSIHRLTEST